VEYVEMNINKIKTIGALLIAGLISVTAMSEESDSTLSSFTAEKEVQPIYPQKALDRKISGYTLVKYKIGSNGRPKNVDIIEAQPAGVFNAASRRAVMRTKFAAVDASEAEAKGETFYKMYVYELEETNTNALAASN